MYLNLPEPNVHLEGSFKGYTTSYLQTYWTEALQDAEVSSAVLYDLSHHMRGQTVGVTNMGETVIYEHDFKDWFYRSQVIRSLNGVKS